MTVIGLDISKWNGTWDTVKAREAGARFVFIKSSQATFTDIRFVDNWKNAKAAGLLRGAYHYMDYTKPPRDSANYFANLLEADRGELPPVVDYEQQRPDKNATAARNYLKEFIEQLKNRGHKPIIYTSPSYWAYYGSKDNTWLQYPLWIAHYTTKPAPTVPLPWTKWTFWQISGKGEGPKYGTQSYGVDVNYFNGSEDELYAFAGVSKPVTPPQETTTMSSQEYNVLNSLFVALDQRVNSMDKRIITVEQRVTTLEQFAKTVTVTQPTTQPPVTTPTSTPTTGTQPVTTTPQAGTTTTTTTTPPATTTTPAAPETYAVCTAFGLNVRSGPGSTYPVVAGLVSGQRVQVLERKNGWARLNTPAGWSSEQYLRFM